MVATMNAMTEGSVDWNPAGRGPTAERRAETVRNSLSGGPKDFKWLSARPSNPYDRPQIVRTAGEHANRLAPTAVGAGRMCQNLFTDDGQCEFPDELLPPVPQGKRMSSEAIKHISDASFETDVLKSGTPVLVDYWAEWCGPCKAIAPILEEVAKDYGPRLQIAKMNVDDNRDVPAKFGIRGIPTLMLFKDGQLAATKVGALSKSQLTAFLEGHLA
jgi:thioredoxin 1